MCGVKSKKSFKQLFLFCVLLFVFSCLSLNASTQEVILSNLSHSEQLLTTLNLQLRTLEEELNSKNTSLTNLQATNLELNNQFQTLQILSQSQTATLSNLSETNLMLMGQLEQSEQQYTDLNQQYQQLSQQLSKTSSNGIWWFIGGILVGGVVCGFTAWLATR